MNLQVSLGSGDCLELHVRWAHKNGTWPITAFRIYMADNNKLLAIADDSNHVLCFSNEESCIRNKTITPAPNWKAYEVKVRNARGEERIMNVMAVDHYEAFYRTLDLMNEPMYGLADKGYRIVGVSP